MTGVEVFLELVIKYIFAPFPPLEIFSLQVAQMAFNSSLAQIE